MGNLELWGFAFPFWWSRTWGCRDQGKGWRGGYWEEDVFSAWWQVLILRGMRGVGRNGVCWSIGKGKVRRSGMCWGEGSGKVRLSEMCWSILKGLPPALYRQQALSVAWTNFLWKYCLTFGGHFSFEDSDFFLLKKLKKQIKAVYFQRRHRARTILPLWG